MRIEIKWFPAEWWVQAIKGSALYREMFPTRKLATIPVRPEPRVMRRQRRGEV